MQERRSAQRYPIRLGMEYRVAGKAAQVGTGQTVNLSSHGVLFEAEKPLAARLPIELSLSWPALLEDAVHLQLKVRGETVWVKGQYTGVKIFTYDFHVRGQVPDRAPA